MFGARKEALQLAGFNKPSQETCFVNGWGEILAAIPSACWFLDFGSAITPLPLLCCIDTRTSINCNDSPGHHCSWSFTAREALQAMSPLGEPRTAWESALKHTSEAVIYFQKANTVGAEAPLTRKRLHPPARHPTWCRAARKAPRCSSVPSQPSASLPCHPINRGREPSAGWNLFTSLSPSQTSMRLLKIQLPVTS